jgi:cobalt-precorrin-7 (C5)-methyltransferase
LAKIFLIGAGPGTKEHLTPAARENVRRATVVIGAERALEVVREDIKNEAYVLKAENLGEIVQRALSSAHEGKSVAMVSTGDPTFFGLLKALTEKFPNDFELEIVPGISSIQVCTARLQICLEEIGLILSFHGQPNVERTRLVEAVRNGKMVMVLPDPKSFQPDQISKYLIDSGIDPKTPAAVCENLTYVSERISDGDLLTISSQKYDPMCLMVIGNWARRRLRRLGH